MHPDPDGECRVAALVLRRHAGDRLLRSARTDERDSMRRQVLSPQPTGQDTSASRLVAASRKAAPGQRKTAGHGASLRHPQARTRAADRCVHLSRPIHRLRCPRMGNLRAPTERPEAAQLIGNRRPQPQNGVWSKVGRGQRRGNMARLRPARLLGDLYTAGHGECFKSRWLGLSTALEFTRRRQG